MHKFKCNSFLSRLLCDIASPKKYFFSLSSIPFFFHYHSFFLFSSWCDEGKSEQGENLFSLILKFFRNLKNPQRMLSEEKCAFKVQRLLPLLYLRFPNADNINWGFEVRVGNQGAIPQHLDYTLCINTQSPHAFMTFYFSFSVFL